MSVTRKSMKLIRRLVILAVGLPVVGLGIILVPLPGPGVLVMLLGLFILSLEFDWAKKYVDQLKAKLREIIDAAQKRANDRQDKL